MRTAGAAPRRHGQAEDRNDTLSDTAARYWAVLDDLCRAIDHGDSSIGLPPYVVVNIRQHRFRHLQHLLIRQFF
jgi:hypothetical protein